MKSIWGSGLLEKKMPNKASVVNNVPEQMAQAYLKKLAIL